jgi:hypothetical protein
MMGGTMDNTELLAHTESVARRTRKGVSTYKVIRRHERRTSTGERARTLIERADAILALADSFDLVSPSTGRTIVADAIGADHAGRPVYSARTNLTGTDMGLSWQHVVSTSGDTDAAADLAHDVARHRCSQRSALAHLFGVDVGEVGEVGDDGVMPHEDRPFAGWPARTKLPRLVARADERPASVKVANPFPSAWNVGTLTVRAIAAPTDDGRVFVGNDKPRARTESTHGKHVKRAEVRAEASAERRAEASDAVCSALQTDDGKVLAEAWTDADEGSRVSVDLPGGGSLAFTRGTGRPVRFTWTAGDRSASWTSRTVGAAAIRLAPVTD